MTMPFYRFDQHRHQRTQAFAADPVRCLPNHNQSLAYGLSVEPATRRGPVFPPAMPARSKRIACLR